MTLLGLFLAVCMGLALGLLGGGGSILAVPSSSKVLGDSQFDSNRGSSSGSNAGNTRQYLADS
jgi:uncharacterized membrane protein YfcA